MRSQGTRPALRAFLAIAGVLLAALASLGAPAPSLAAPSQAELESAQDQLMQLERDFEIVVERYNQVRVRLDKLRAQIAVDDLVASRITKRITDNTATAETVATELYMGGTTRALEVVLDSHSLAEVDARLAYLRSSEAAQSKVFERLTADRRLLEDRIARLEKAQAEALAAQERLGALRTEIEEKVADQQDEIARLTEVIERAERRRERREAAAEAAAAAAAASAPTSAAPAEAIGPIPDANSRAGIAVQVALDQVGDPYQWGGSGPDSFDCSGLTSYAWAQAGVSLPHSSSAQYAATPRVDQSDLQPGDLLFFGSPIHHVAMYVGGGQMVEAPYTGASVRVTSSSRSDYVGAGRPGV